jgi:hypothetical protein
MNDQDYIKDPTLKDRYHISADELEHRMQLQEKYHNDPAKQAVAILDMALERVLSKLGVNVELGDIPDQQDQLGIYVFEESREEMAGLQGFFVFVSRKNDLIPFAWIGQAMLNNLGECSCEIHWFRDNRLEEVGGVKIL